MSFRVASVTAALASLALVVPASAPADGIHVIAPGETLSGIAAANRLSTSALAAANGLSPTAFVIAGRTLSIPAAGAAATTVAAPAPLSGYRVRTGDTLSAIAAEHRVSVAQLAAVNGLRPDGVIFVGASLRLPGPGVAAVRTATGGPGAPRTTAAGSRLVNPGETLWGIAVANGITPAALAAANGFRVDHHLIAGTRLRIPAGTGATAVAEPATTATSAPTTGGGRLTAGQISQIAAQQGAPAALVTAIAWQESGFNNAKVSLANARGIMQVIPSAWTYVQNELGAGRLDPASPADNVRAGSILLRRLLSETGDPATAVAAYYQGLSSVRRIGMLPETRQYVANVLALSRRFGG